MLVQFVNFNVFRFLTALVHDNTPSTSSSVNLPARSLSISTKSISSQFSGDNSIPLPVYDGFSLHFNFPNATGGVIIAAANSARDDLSRYDATFASKDSGRSETEVIFGLFGEVLLRLLPPSEEEAVMMFTCTNLLWFKVTERGIEGWRCRAPASIWVCCLLCRVEVDDDR